MRTGLLLLMLLVLATGAIMAGGNMDNKLPAMLIVAVCVTLMGFLINRSRVRN